MINGDAGWLGWCSTAHGARDAADGAVQSGATGVMVHRGEAQSVVRILGDAESLEHQLRAHCDVALYRTGTRHVLRHVRTWPLGAVTPGVTMLFSIHRRPGMDVSEFHRWWEESHAPIALRHHVGMWDYAQVSVVETLYGEPMDGFAVTQWPTLDDLLHRFSSGPEGTDALRHDAAQFTDPTTLRRFLLDETVLLDASWPLEGDLPVGLAHSVELPDETWVIPDELPPGVSAEVRLASDGRPRLDVLWRTVVPAGDSARAATQFETWWRQITGHVTGPTGDQLSSSS